MCFGSVWISDSMLVGLDHHDLVIECHPGAAWSCTRSYRINTLPAMTAVSLLYIYSLTNVHLQPA